MTKSKKFLKILAWLLVTLAIAYTAAWFVVVDKISREINKNYVGKAIYLFSSYGVDFSKACIGGFPFNIDIDLDGFTEESIGTIVKHSSPLKISYNVLEQKLYAGYNGESVAKYKPENSGFGYKLSGKYSASLDMPLNFALLKVLLLGRSVFEVVNSINNLKISSKDVTISDLIDDSVVLGKASAGLKFAVKNHQYYRTMEELKNSIPSDYTININMENSGASPSKRTVPPSLIYGIYIPMNLKYEFDVDLHTDAKKFLLSDIMGGFSIKSNRLNYKDDSQKTSSKLEFGSSIQDKDMKLAIDYSTKAYLSASYGKELSKTLVLLANTAPLSPNLQVVKQTLQHLDFSAIDFDTKGNPLEFWLKAALAEDSKGLELNISNIGVSFQNAGIEIRSIFNSADGASLAKGVVSIWDYEMVLNYLIGSYFAINNAANTGEFNDKFYFDVYNEVLNTVANSTNPAKAAMLIDYDISKNLKLTNIGKLTWPAATLVYYSTLFKHVQKISKNREDAINKFKTIVSEDVLKPDVLDKITK